MEQWKYFKNENEVVFDSINAFPDNAYGFVYIISFEDGSFYIGKKNLFSYKKRNFGKKEIAALTDKRLKKYETVKKESNWRVYNSSNSFVKYKIDKGYAYEKNILGIAFSKKHLTYLEAESLFYFKALENKDCLNDNILGKFFKSDYEQWLSQVQK